MSNTVAIYVGLTILAALTVDYAIFGSEHLIFLFRKMTDVLVWMAFWR